MKREAAPAIEEYGLRAKLAMRTRIARSTMTEIFSGKRRATARQAALLEAEFVKRGIPLNRWDLLYGVGAGESLKHYLESGNALQHQDGGNGK